MHCFRNFKSFAEAEIDLQQAVTLLVGPNGSGKTNLIEGVELLAQIALGLPLHQVVDVGRGSRGSFEVRGGLDGCVRDGQDEFELSVRFDGYVADWQPPVSYSVTYAAPIRALASETLVAADASGRQRTILRAQGGERDGLTSVTYDNFRQGPRPREVSIRSDRSALSQYGVFARDNGRAESCLALTDSVRDLLSSASTLAPNPGAMRSYARILEGWPLQRDGANLSAVLHAMAPDALTAITGRIRQLPEEPIHSIDFVTTDAHDVMLAFRMGERAERVDARVLSDGTLRCLAILTALEAAQEGSLLIIEEVDNGLHPSRAGVLTSALFETAERRRVRVLATTHNPATLNALSDEQLGAVVLCTSVGTEGGSRLVRLSDFPRYVEFIEGGRLGDLITARIADQYLAPDFAEKRKQAMRELLEAMGA